MWDNTLQSIIEKTEALNSGRIRLLEIKEEITQLEIQHTRLRSGCEELAIELRNLLKKV